MLLPAAARGLRADSKAQAEQLRAVAAERFLRRVGAVPKELLAELDAALRQHLALGQPLVPQRAVAVAVPRAVLSRGTGSMR